MGGRTESATGHVGWWTGRQVDKQARGKGRRKRPTVRQIDSRTKEAKVNRENGAPLLEILHELVLDCSDHKGERWGGRGMGGEARNMHSLLSMVNTHARTPFLAFCP